MFTPTRLTTRSTLAIPSQYQQYQQLRLARNLAQDQLATAELNQQAAMNWDMWGPIWY